MRLDVGYRYLGSSDFEYGSTNIELGSHNVTAGVRYTFQIIQFLSDALGTQEI
jgi:opacity protein-like surface antigen